MAAGEETTIDSWNRRRDADRVSQRLGIAEQGCSTQEFYALADNQTPVARGYNRVVYGDHGPYIEFSAEQIRWTLFPYEKIKGQRAFYDESYHWTRNLMVYRQKRSVRGQPNPPAGPWSVRNHRREGYADYRSGLCYIAADLLQTASGDSGQREPSFHTASEGTASACSQPETAQLDVEQTRPQDGPPEHAGVQSGLEDLGRGQRLFPLLTLAPDNTIDAEGVSQGAPAVSSPSPVPTVGKKGAERHKQQSRALPPSSPLDRRRGHRGSQGRRLQSFCLHFANITSMSDKAFDYIQHNPPDFGVYVESHVGARRLHFGFQPFLQQHWQVTAAPADDSTTSTKGTYGGAVSICRPHLSQRPLQDDRPLRRLWKSGLHQAAGRQVRLNGVGVLLLGGYHKDEVQPAMLQELYTITNGGSVPFIYAADFNKPPEWWDGSPWLHHLRCRVVAPDQATCTSGDGATLDYFLISDSLWPYILSLEVITSVPWSPHFLLALRLLRSAHLVKKRICVCPKELPEPMLGPFQLHDIRLTPELVWVTAMDSAAEQVETIEDSDTNTASRQSHALVAQVGGLTTSKQVELSLQRWAYAVEDFALNMGPPRDAEFHENFHGRCQQPRYKLVPALQDATPQNIRSLSQAPASSVSLGSAARLIDTMLQLLNRTQHINLDIQRRAKADLMELSTQDDPQFQALWERLGLAREKRLHVLLARTLNGQQAPDFLQNLLKAHARQLQAEDREHRNKRWQNIIHHDLKQGGRIAHRWTNAPNVTHYTILESKDRSPAPLDVAASSSASWGSKWNVDDMDRRQDVLAALKAFRVSALSRPLPDPWWEHQFHPSTIRAAARSFAAHTSTGADHIDFGTIGRLLDLALARLGDIFCIIIKNLALPLSQLHIQLHEIGKKLGGSRTIGTAGTIIRLFLRLLAGDFRQWDSTVPVDDNFFDSASADHSAPIEAAWRQTVLESADAAGWAAILLLWDYETFYESMRVDTLIILAEELGLPPAATYVALLLHASPRVLETEGCYGPAIADMASSIFTGCTSCTSFARAYLHPTLRRSLEEHSTRHQNVHTLTGQHVDDVVHVVIAKSSSTVLKRAGDLGVAMAAGARRLELTLSLKSTVLANNWKLATRTSKLLSFHGLSVKPAKVAEDLGIGTSGAARRTTSFQARRLKKGHRRARRIQLLYRQHRRAKRLYLTGVKPQQFYDVQCAGAAPSAIRAARASALAAVVAPRTITACPASALLWHFDAEVDPALQAPLAQLTMWWRLHSRVDQAPFADLIKGAWRTLRDKFSSLPADRQWRAVKGPLAATIVTLLGAGWKPDQFNVWVAPKDRGVAMLSTAPYEWHTIKDAFISSTQDKIWTAAARTPCGGGLEQGVPSVRPAKTAQAWLRKQGLHLAANLVPCIISASSQPVAIRRTASGAMAADEEPCPWCGAPNTLRHRHYECQSLADLPDPHDILRKSAYLSSLIQEPLWEDIPCLWARGLLPHNFCDITELDKANLPRLKSSVSIGQVQPGSAFLPMGPGARKRSLH